MKQKVYFPNLNGLRFIAAALVIIHHIEQFKAILKLDNFGAVSFVNIIGRLGVILFFVLSGFLITYLLLAEEKQTKTIAIKEFYIRRILRIWPLYFFIIILALGVLPFIDMFEMPGFGREQTFENLGLKLILFALVLPNVLISVAGVVPYASHTWSIGTEEQFYLFWPVLLKFIKRNRLVLMFVIIGLYLIIKYILNYVLPENFPYLHQMTSLWRIIPIDCMAIGGIFATLLFNESSYLKYFLRLDLFVLSALTTILLLVFGVNFGFFQFEIYSIFFALIILNLASNPSLKNALEFEPLSYFGRISYGLYMYHSIAIMISLKLVLELGFKSNWIIYPVTFIMTIIMAGLSYKYLESYFLKFKTRFAKIASGTKP